MSGSRKRPRDNSSDCMQLTAFFKRYSYCQYTLNSCILIWSCMWNHLELREKTLLAMVVVIQSQFQVMKMNVHQFLVPLHQLRRLVILVCREIVALVVVCHLIYPRQTWKDELTLEKLFKLQIVLGKVWTQWWPNYPMTKENSTFPFTLSLPPPTLFTLIWLLRPVRPGMHVSKCDGWNGSLGCHTVPYLQEVFAGIVFSFQNGQIEGSH